MFYYIARVITSSYISPDFTVFLIPHSTAQSESFLKLLACVGVLTFLHNIKLVYNCLEPQQQQQQKKS